MPESLVLLVGLSFVWVDDDTVTDRDGNRDWCRSTRFPNSFRIVQDRLTDSHENAGGIVPVCEPVWFGD